MIGLGGWANCSAAKFKPSEGKQESLEGSRHREMICEDGAAKAITVELIN